MHPVLERIHQRARKANAAIALPEAEDARVLRAAARAAGLGIARPILVGDPDRVAAAADLAGVALPGPVLEPEADPEVDAMADELRASLAERGIPHRSEATFAAWVREPIVYADLLVRNGRADGAVMGAVATTSQTLRAALRVIGVDPRHSVVTSCFLMLLEDEQPLIFADCGVIPDPDADQLADIAVQAANAYRLLVEKPPQVALLAFSTHGSASHPSLEKVRAAVSSLDRRHDIDFAFDGELQADAALVPEIGASKAPDSSVAGKANVLVFPDLNSGNIAYKLTERLAGARAIGPLLRGLRRPVHDLSRGCTEADVLDTMAIAALEAGTRRNG